MNIRALSLILFCIAFVFPASNSFAAIYKYLDANGTPSFADNLQSVPEQFRASVVIVSGKLKRASRTLRSLKKP